MSLDFEIHQLHLAATRTRTTRTWLINFARHNLLISDNFWSQYYQGVFHLFKVDVFAWIVKMKYLCSNYLVDRKGHRRDRRQWWLFDSENSNSSWLLVGSTDEKQVDSSVTRCLNKSSPICSKSCRGLSFYLKSDVFQNSTKYMGYFRKKFVAKNVQNSPNLVTLVQSVHASKVERES